LPRRPSKREKSGSEAAHGRFSSDELDALDRSKILGVRSGAEHRFTGVWVVVVEGRVFARSWNDEPNGWFRAFRREPAGCIRVGDSVLGVRGKPVRNARLREAVTAAFARKYDTEASQKWVRGFAEAERAANTIEFERV
jgi:hypothetical protein